MRARRNPKLIIVGLLCLLLAAGGLMLVWRTINATQAVLVTTHDVAAGQVLAADDVEVAHVGLGQSVVWLPIETSIDGQVALTDLKQGSVLVAGVVGNPPVGQSGLVRTSVVVGVGLAPVAVLPVEASVGLCGPDGQTIFGIVASEPHLLPDGARYRFDVRVSAGDAPTLVRWVTDETVVVSTP